MTHTYVYASGRLLRETFGDTTLDFFYSNSGQPYALSHNGTTYYYITNVQGDVMSIVDGTGAVVAEYEYDPYGNIISATGELAEVNPLRYRGYVYDQDTGLYYLQSRYYDPQTGRFINADVYASTGQGVLGNNMFAYCTNNPICRADYSGFFSITEWWEDICDNAHDWLEKKKEESKDKTGTRASGLTLSGAFGWGGSVSGGITSDRKGNVGIIVSTTGGAGTPSWGFGGFRTYTNAPEIYDQAGLGVQVGGSISVGPSVGGDYVMLINPETGETYHGGTATVGIGWDIIPVELHGDVGYSWVWGFNIYDVGIAIIDTICPGK